MPYGDTFFRSIVDHGATLIWVAGLDKGCYYFNQPWLAFTGRTLEQEYGNGWAEGVHPDDFERCLAIYTAAFDQRQPFSMPYRLKRHDGRYRWIQDDGVPSFDAQGEFTGYIGHCLDIHELKMAEIRQRQHNRLMTMIASGQSLDDLMKSFVKHLHELYVGYRFCLYYAASESDGAKRSAGQWRLPVVDSSGQLLAHLMVTGREDADMDPVVQSGLSHELTLAALIMEKIRADEVLKLQQQALERMAHYDALTKLPNRVTLLAQLREKMAWCRQENQQLAVAFIDLDGFKAVNDQHSHAAGDDLLVALSARMKAQLRPNDELARLGGDEFVLLLPDIKTLADSIPVVERLLACISEPVRLSVGMVQVSASIGITHYPPGETTTAEALIQQADHAMYQAKHNGRNQYQLFQPFGQQTAADSGRSCS